MFIHQRGDWPQFTWDDRGLSARLGAVRYRQGRLISRMEGLGFLRREEAVLNTLVQDVVKTSEIEGELLDREQVRSSLARRLGVEIGGLQPVDRDVEGVVEMTLDATQSFDQPLDEQRLRGWHAALFPGGWSGLHPIRVGAWRDDSSGPMQVVSGRMGREWVHYEAPPAPHLADEMAAFCRWFNEPDQVDLVLRAAVAHLWFVSIHPFDDGNGRIARAITDMALARSEGSPQRFYSMSAQIRLERNDYYHVLERTQKGTLDVTDWVQWFLGCLDRAFAGAEITLAQVLVKARFWDGHTGESFHERQLKVINRLLDGLDGKLTTSKWARLAKCSQDTAGRDINDLIERGILFKEAAGGRNTSYALRTDPPAP